MHFCGACPWETPLLVSGHLSVCPSLFCRLITLEQKKLLEVKICCKEPKLPVIGDAGFGSKRLSSRSLYHTKLTHRMTCYAFWTPLWCFGKQWNKALWDTLSIDGYTNWMFGGYSLKCWWKWLLIILIPWISNISIIIGQL